jgi:hypothetical protein
MTNQFDFILITIGAVLPTAFAFYVFLSPTRAYVKWARLASIAASIAGLVWGVFDWLFLHSQSVHLSYAVRGRLTGLTGIVGGIMLGIMLSILIARPYKERESPAAPAQ